MQGPHSGQHRQAGVPETLPLGHCCIWATLEHRPGSHQGQPQLASSSPTSLMSHSPFPSSALSSPQAFG